MKIIVKYKKMIKNNSIICGDCLEIMKDIPDKSIDLVLTDPPYGIDINVKGFGRTKNIPHTEFIEVEDWDKFTPGKKYFDEIFRISKNQIIFGGNYFIDKLYPTACYVIWDKRCGVIPERTYADCEMAWTSFSSPARIIRFIWDGMLQGNMKDKDVRQHPTQKPIEVIRQILLKYSEEDDLIIDPFLGSGTTAFACQELHRNFIGIEISEKYCEIARNRLKQKPLF